MAEIITRLKFETDEFHNRARRAAQDANEMAQQLEVAGNKMAIVNDKNLKLAQSFGKMQTVSTTLRGKISELSETFMAYGQLYNRLSAQEKSSPYGKAVAQSLEQLKVRVRETKAELAGLESSLNGASAGGGFGKKFAQGLMPGLGMGVGAAGAMLAVKSVQKVAQLGKEAIAYNIQTNMEFEQSNANLSAVLGKTRDEMAALTENAKMLGQTTLFTANQITELQTVLARRGFSQEQILDMTHGISNLALATGTDLAQSAELAGSTMQAFGMSATQMERIVSVLGVSTTKCALTTQSLGTSLQYVAPTAKAAGYSIEDTVAMLGVLVDAGIDASTAGTALRQIILSMSTANGKFAKSIGHPVKNLEDFKEALNHVTDAEDMLSDASEQVRVTAVPALLALANNKDRLGELRGELDNVSDKLQEMADKQCATLKSQVTLLKSAWDGLMLSIGNSDGILKQSIKVLTDWINAMNKAQALRNGGVGARTAAGGGVKVDKKSEDEYKRQFNMYYYDKKRFAGMSDGDRKKAINKLMIEQYEGVVDDRKKESENVLGLVDSFNKSIGTTGTYDKTLAKKVLSFIEYGARRFGIKELQGFSQTEDALFSGKIAEAGYRVAAAYKNNEDFARGILGAARSNLSELLELEAQEKSSTTTGGTKTGGTKTGGRSKKSGSTKTKAETVKGTNFIETDGANQLWNYTEEGISNWIKFLNETTSKIDPTLKEFRELSNQAVDMKSLQSLWGVAKRYGMDDVLKDMESEFNTIGENAQDVTEEAWKEIVDRINAKLKEQNLPEIELDYTTGTLKNKSTKIARDNIDNKILNGMIGVAKENKIGFDKLGISGLKDKIRNGEAIGHGTWNSVAENLNKELKKRGVTWFVDVDFETGSLEKLKTRLQECFEAFDSGLGGVNSFVDTIDGVKNAWESMMDTINSTDEDVDGWKKLMSVWQLCMTVLQGIVTSYEAINTLKGVFSMLTGKETASTIAQTTSTTALGEAQALQTSAGAAQVVMNESVAASELAMANASMAAANAAKTAEMALIPGGAALLPAVLAKMNGAYIAGLGMAKVGTAMMHFANGGMVPGLPNGGIDTYPALLSPGEVILNASQQKAVAAQLQPSRALSGGYGGHVTFEIDGRKLIGTINNEIAATGGGRAHRIYSH